MPRKAIAISAYLSGCSSREAARRAGLRSSSYVRRLIQSAGISRPVGRPSKIPQGAGRAE